MNEFKEFKGTAFSVADEDPEIEDLEDASSCVDGVVIPKAKGPDADSFAFSNLLMPEEPRPVAMPQTDSVSNSWSPHDMATIFLENFLGFLKAI